MSVENVTTPAVPHMSPAEKAAKLRGKGSGHTATVKVALPVKGSKAKVEKRPTKGKAKSKAPKLNKYQQKAMSKQNKPVEKSGGKSGGSPVCSICGKPLTRESSKDSGMGPDCARKLAMLPSGTTMEDHYEKITVSKVPEGFVKFRSILPALKKSGYSHYRLTQAIGGDRMIRPPLNAYFKVVLVDGIRYINKDVVKHFGDLAKK